MWFFGALLVAAFMFGACELGPRPPDILGPTAWRLTVSPIEPTAGIPAEVTMQRIDDQARPLRATSDDVPPHVRARDLATEEVIWAGPAQVDGRGMWVAPIVFPSVGRWQVVLHEAIDPRVPIREGARFPWPSLDPYGPDQVIRDAIGREQLTLLLTVGPDRGAIIWWIRTHIPQVFVIVLVLSASVVSYFFRGRVFARAGG